MKKALKAWTVPKQAYTVKAVVKTLAILEILADGGKPSYTLTEISRRVRLHVSTVHRLLANLLRHGYVEQNLVTGGYQLSFRVMRMGLRVLDRLDFRRVAQPFLRELNQKAQETVHLAILQGDHAVSIEKYSSPQPVMLDAPLGGVVPLYCTGVGKALLAYQEDGAVERVANATGLGRYTEQTLTTLPELRKELARVREAGYAVDNEEIIPGLRCVAAPLFDRDGRVVAAFSVAGPSSRMVPARDTDFAAMVLETSSLISYRLGFFPAQSRLAAAAKPAPYRL